LRSGFWSIRLSEYDTGIDGCHTRLSNQGEDDTWSGWKDGHPLSLDQLVSVPDEAQGRWFGVAAGEQPGQVGDSGAEPGSGFGTKPGRVLGAGASCLRASGMRSL
jgi:hypothetical protein